MAWTSEAIRILRESHGTMSNAFIARRIQDLLGIVFTRNAIVGKAWRIGLRAPVEKNQTSIRAPRKARSPSPVNNGNKTGWKVRIRTRAPVPVAVYDRFAPPVHLLDLTTRQCRYVIGEPSGLMFCGQPTPVSGCSWCTKHLKIVSHPYLAKPIV